MGCFSLLKKSKTCGSYPDNLAPIEIFLRDETAVLGILPNREPGARRAPNINHFLVGSVASCEPLEQVGNQCVNGCIHHGILCF